MNTITYGHKVAGVGIEPIPPYMVAKEFDSTAKQQFDGTMNMQSMRAILGFGVCAGIELTTLGLTAPRSDQLS